MKFQDLEMLLIKDEISKRVDAFIDAIQFEKTQSLKLFSEIQVLQNRVIQLTKALEKIRGKPDGEPGRYLNPPGTECSFYANEALKEDI